MTLIILEGNECNFKTTVAEKLSKKLGWEVVKGSSFEMSQCNNEELYQKFIDLTKLDNVIIDRFTWSNLVYASLYEDFSIITLEQAKEIQRLIVDKAYVVFLHADHEVLIERIGVRGDDYVKTEKLESINKKYWEVIVDTLDIQNPKSEFKSFQGNMFDTAKYGSDDIVESILSKVAD